MLLNASSTGRGRELEIHHPTWENTCVYFGFKWLVHNLEVMSTHSGLPPVKTYKHLPCKAPLGSFMFKVTPPSSKLQAIPAPTIMTLMVGQWMDLGGDQVSDGGHRDLGSRPVQKPFGSSCCRASLIISKYMIIKDIKKQIKIDLNNSI